MIERLKYTAGHELVFEGPQGNFVATNPYITEMSHVEMSDVYDCNTVGHAYFKRPGRPRGVRINFTFTADEVVLVAKNLVPVPSKDPSCCHILDEDWSPAPEDVVGFDVSVKVGGTFDVRRLHASPSSTGALHIDDAVDTALEELRPWLRQLLVAELRG